MVIRERTERGRRAASKIGNYIGQQIVYGWKTQKVPGEKRQYSKIVRDEKEYSGLIKMIEMAEQGLSSREIAREMTRLGYITKNGNTKWNKSVPNDIFKSTWLYGVATVFKKTSTNIKGKGFILISRKKVGLHLKSRLRFLRKGGMLFKEAFNRERYALRSKRNIQT